MATAGISLFKHVSTKKRLQKQPQAPPQSKKKASVNQVKQADTNSIPYKFNSYSKKSVTPVSS